MTVVTERKSIKQKAQMVEEIVELFDKYNTIAFADLYKVRAIQLQQLAQKLRKDIHMRLVKISILNRVLTKSRKPNIEKLAEYLEGSTILLLTNMNPFQLALLLEKHKMQLTAKAGDIAQNDIIIARGNTGLPPGPAISELSEVGIRTKIEGGSVWVINDVVLVKTGEVIQMKVASVLSKLGIKPIEVGLTVKASYDKGFVFTSDQLRPKIAEVKKQIDEAVSKASNLAVNTVYPSALTIRFILQLAAYYARNLAVNANYATPEVVHEIIAKAHCHMVSLASKIAEINRDALSSELLEDMNVGKD